MDVDVEGRRFLLDTDQRVVLAFAAGSEDDTVVAAHVTDPFTDRNEVVIERCWWAYVSTRIPAPFEVLSPALSMPVEVGQAYAFDGVELMSDGIGVPALVVLRYDASPSSTRPVTVGLAISIHDSASGPTPPTPIDHHLLNRFEARLIPAPRPELLVFIASGVEPGMVLPRRVLVPVTPGAPIAGARSSNLGGTIELGRYLLVDLSEPEQAVIHFDRAKNAFGHGL